MTIKELEKKRQLAAERFWETDDLLGYQVKDASGWEHTIGENNWERVIFVEPDEGNGPSVSKKLVLSFEENSEKIKWASIDGHPCDFNRNPL